MIAYLESWSSIARLAAHAGPSTLRYRSSSLPRSPASHVTSRTCLQPYSTEQPDKQDDPSESVDHGVQRLFESEEGMDAAGELAAAEGNNEADSEDEEPPRIGEYQAAGRSWDLNPPEEAFDDVVKEILRRKKKAEAKRMQRGGFLDHLTVQIRGGRGGNGAAAFSMTQKGTMGPPSGGNGGSGGSVYICTSPTLTSLHTLARRMSAGTGGNGKGDTLHGRPGEDFVMEVPIGTVIREMKRTPEAGSRFALWRETNSPPTTEPVEPPKIAQPEIDEDLDDLEQSEVEQQPEAVDETISEAEKKIWDRLFVHYPGAEFTRTEYRRAENRLRQAGRSEKPPPNFDRVPPKLFDLEVPTTGDPILLARGGRGGVGNPFFAGFSGFRQPRIASRGTIPYTSTYEFELKILADVGLVGFPNVGKSTILRALTGRRAEVADYSFTTLNPQIGVVRVMSDGSYSVDEGTVVEDTVKERELDAKAREQGGYRPLPRSERIRSSEKGGDAEIFEVSRFTVSDNPGLLPLASENVGLGHSFLRSIERSLALTYVLDITRSDPAEDLMTLRNELDTYKAGLTSKGTVVVLNKGDQVDEGLGKERLDSVKRLVETLPEGKELFVTVLSGKFGLGLKRMVQKLSERIEKERKELAEQTTS